MGAALKLCEDLELSELAAAPPQLRLVASNDNASPDPERTGKPASRANLRLVEKPSPAETEKRFKEASSSEFTGKEEDVEVGLQYFGKRYLNPLLGRWVSADPLAVHAPGSSGEFNVYAYVSGQILKNTDPLGLADDEEDAAADTGDGGSTSSAMASEEGVASEEENQSYLEPEAEAAEADSATSTGRTRALQITSYPDEARDEAARAWAGCSGANSGGGACYFGAAVTGTMLNAYAFGGDLLNTGNIMLRSVEAASEGEIAESGAYALQAVGNITYALQALRMLRTPLSAGNATASAEGAGSSSGGVPGLAQLPEDVAMPVAPGEAIQIPRALTPAEMAALTNTSGNIEVSQTFFQGAYYLTRASHSTPNLVSVLPWRAGVQWISHSHPAGYSGMPSVADRQILKLLGQGTSTVVRPSGTSVRFGLDPASDVVR